MEDARDFGRMAHFGQVRKYTGEPYHVHPEAVADTVSNYIQDEDVLIAALGHDIKEDTKVTVSEISSRFGARVLSIILELTDVYTRENFPTMKRFMRKQYEAERLAEISFEAKTIKLADLQNNIYSIVEHDPEFAIVYLKEKAEAMKYLVGGHPTLYGIVEKQLIENLDKLNIII